MEQRFEQILALAIKKKSTDIHFVIDEGKTTIRLRGIYGLERIETFENDEGLFNYLMYQSRLDITNKIPQSGSFHLFFQGNFYDFRFAVIQTDKMKSGVLRILNCHTGLSLQQITMDKEMQKTLIQTIKRRNGLVIFSGPTGSGKTTTMYSLLKMLKDRTIYSLEDPIEVIQDNIVQIEINAKKGLGFDEGIRQILRHNPDVLMVGEIRDEITAKMAIRAALTGCLVVSSLHAYSCSSALHRLLDLGCNKNDLLDCCEMIFNQRLVKLKNKKGYICILDQMNHNEVEKYFESGIFTNQLESNFQRALMQGWIENEND